MNPAPLPQPWLEPRFADLDRWFREASEEEIELELVKLKQDRFHD